MDNHDARNGAHFFTGDQVCWQEHCFGPYVTPFEELYGEGPFEVKETQAVPKELQSVVTHCQWVFLEIQGVTLRLSGALLKKVL